MYPNEKAEFAIMLRDMCTSVDRPFDEDMLRVFWDDLEHVPFAQVQRQSKLIRASGKKRFLSSDLRPPPEERAKLNPDSDNDAIMNRIDAYILRYLWPTLSQRQRMTAGREWVYDTRDRSAPRLVAMRIKPDVDHEDCPNEVRYSGHYIKLEDCDMEYTPPPKVSQPHETTFADRYQNFDEANAVRDVLNRRE